jgi:hypothetical protein
MHHLADRSLLDDLVLAEMKYLQPLEVLDGSGARTDVTVDGHLYRWYLLLIEQLQRYLSQRFAVPPSDLSSPGADLLHTGVLSAA